jgi:hypothetical protein
VPGRRRRRGERELEVDVNLGPIQDGACPEVAGPGDLAPDVLALAYGQVELAAARPVVCRAVLLLVTKYLRAWETE